MEEGIVEITVTRRIPVLLVVICTFWTGKECLLEDTGIARLIECGDAELLVSVFLDDAEGVIVGIERCHEDERDVDAVGGVEMLDLTDGEVKEGHVVLDFEGTLCTGHSWDNVRREERKRGRNGPMEVPRPPLTLRTASLLRLDVSFGFGRSA